MNRFILSAFAVAAFSSSFAALTVPSEIISPFTTAVDENKAIATLAAIGEARVGSRTVGGNTFELDVQDFSTAGTSNIGQTNGEHAWTKAQLDTFSLSYTASSRTLGIQVGSDLVTRTLQNDEAFTDLWIRTFANRDRSLVTSIDQLALTTDYGSGFGVGTRSLSVNSHSAPFGGQNGSAVHILSGALSNTKNWTLTGRLGFDWTTATQATQSNAAIQFKLGTPTAAPVPEPASMAVLGLGLAALKRRRKLA